MRVLKLLATLFASESLMQLEVVRWVPQPKGVAAAAAANAMLARARTERMLAVIGGVGGGLQGWVMELDE